NSYDFAVLHAVMDVNEKQKIIMVNRLMEHFNNDISGKKIALWGLAFKPDTDDIREAPALYIIEKLLEAGASVTAFDPEAMENVEAAIGNSITYASNQYEALEDADALVIATEWAVFRTPDFERMGSQLKTKTIFDGRNLYNLDQMKEHQYHYYSVGREVIKP
ncbi:MAG: UDP-glucose/GDP-mannose dehydrogenase family protein, partial [Bacteroidetes bacterium]|nr:UDP-glucose/GDP-mannose dehydrogenase family protein [Bacteroidota bacterium]